MKTYGHLRDQHSVTMAEKVRFAENEQSKADDEAKVRYSFHWWESHNPLEVFWGQANEQVRLVPDDAFRMAAEMALERAVKVEELASPQKLVAEFVERAPKDTLIDLFRQVTQMAKRRSNGATELRQSYRVLPTFCRNGIRRRAAV